MRVPLALAVMGAIGSTAHMSITITSSTIFPRQKATVGDNYRSPNLSVNCHGTTAGASQATLSIGDTVIGRSTYGAGHGGGHCAWMVTTDQQTYYKINDKIDCTVDFEHDLVIPNNLPTACTTGCTLAWFWTPLLSGQCEIYHSCFDVVVPNSLGGIESSNFNYVPGSNPQCTRVDNTSHKTPNYGPFIGEATGPITPPSNPVAPPSTGSGGGGDGNADEVQVFSDDLTNGCVEYTVIAGDTLAKIGEGFDIEWPIVQQANIVNYPSLETNEDYIDVGWKLQVPQTACAVEAKSCANTDCNVPGAGGSASTLHVSSLAVVATALVPLVTVLL